MRLKIQHRTQYHFDTPVDYGLQQLRKTPKTSQDQKIVTWQTRVEHGRKEVAFDDHHRNRTELIGYDPGTTTLSVISEGEIDVIDTQGIVGPHRGPAPLWLYRQDTPRTQARAGVRALLRSIQTAPSLDGMHALMQGIGASILYEVGSSDPDWSAEDAIEAGKGVCQDHTHIFLSCARLLDMPARYVSGYLMLNEKTAQDAMHAWAEVHIDGLGWVGFDVSNRISPDARYVRVATGLDYAEASPVSGTRIGGAGERLNVQIDVAQQ
ncbi:transglutaminase family protein [Tropicibacter oceani]|uniref:Transglutaminase family protein n=1 Tax=Tropicibacter oceani TaxID=3058420 RepID=A0ABY8QCY3_9RHOB|nr:transglutaminase family protein [Tropicibacter oceani]WGW02349.1 transglutaminase family protein [Tropicibacter oceani]